MDQELWAGLQDVLTAEGNDLDLWRMAARTLLIYLATLLLVRVGSKRFMGKNTAFDVIIGIMLGSVMSRAINGSASLFPTLTAGAVLVGLHWLLAVIAFHTDHIGAILKGHPQKLIKDGELQWETMRKTGITQRDLQEAARSHGRVNNLDQVHEATLERSGDISIIHARSEPKVVDVAVADGVQTVRIRLD